MKLKYINGNWELIFSADIIYLYVHLLATELDIHP